MNYLLPEYLGSCPPTPSPVPDSTANWSFDRGVCCSNMLVVAQQYLGDLYSHTQQASGSYSRDDRSLFGNTICTLGLLRY